MEAPQEKRYPSLKYTIPEWGGNCLKTFQYFFEVIKDGKQIETLELDCEEAMIQDKGWLLIGRLPPEDELPHCTMLHPSISRQHAILQMKNNGQMFIYDLGSTHGTFLNKRQVKPRAYIPLRCGDLLKFGQSSRLYHFTSHSSEVLENTDVSPDELYSQLQGSSEVFSGSYGEMKNFVNKFKDNGKQKKKKKTEEDDEEENDEEEFNSSDDDTRLGVGNEFFLGADGGGDSDDEFFDRTKSKTKKVFKRSDFPVVNKKNVQLQLDEVKKKINQLEKEIESIRATSAEKSIEDDELDSFMSNVVVQERDKNIRKLENQLKDYLKESETLEKQVIALSNPLDRLVPLKREREPIQSKDASPEEPKRKLQKLSPVPERKIVPEKQEKIIEKIENTKAPIIKETPKKKITPKKKPVEQTKLDSENPANYVDWIPPKNQKGDGETHLNAKYGY